MWPWPCQFTGVELKMFKTIKSSWCCIWLSSQQEITLDSFVPRWPARKPKMHRLSTPEKVPSLQLTFASLKKDAWGDDPFPLGQKGLFSGAFCLVLGRDKSTQTWYTPWQPERIEILDFPKRKHLWIFRLSQHMSSWGWETIPFRRGPTLTWKSLD